MNRLLVAKLRRDIRANWTQFLSVFLMAFCSVLIYTGLEGAWHGLDTQLQAYAQSANMADSWVYSTGFTDADIAAITELDSVTGIETNNIMDASRIDGDQVSQLRLTTFTDTSISTPTLTDGAPLDPSSDGIWVDAAYATANSLTVGESVEITIGHTRTALTIEGLILSPNDIYYTGTPSNVAPDAESFGYAYLPADAATAAFGPLGPPTLMQITVRGPDGAAQIRGQAPDILGDRYVRSMDRSTNPGVATAFDRVTQIRNLAVLFSAIFVLLSILSMYTSMRRLIETQSRDVGLLSALGYSAAHIGRHYASFGLVTGGLGGLLGLLVAPAPSLFVLGTQEAMFSLPTWRIAYTPLSIVMYLLIVGICTVAAFAASSRARKLMPAVALRTATTAGRHIVVERAGGIWRRMSAGSRWAMRDALRSPVRLLMGVVAVAGCMMLLFAGFGMPDSMRAQVNGLFEDQYAYAAKVQLAATATPADIAELTGSFPDGQWVQESAVRVLPDDGIDRTLTVYGAGHAIELDLIDGRADGGAVVTSAWAEAAGLRVGDALRVVPPRSTHAVDLIIVGITSSTAPQGLYVAADDWPDFRPTALYTDEVPSVLDPAVGSVLTMAEQQANADALVVDLDGIFTMIKAFAIVLAVVVLYNLGALSFTERRRDYATLRVLGFSLPQLRSLAMRENIATTIVGWLIGIPAGLWFLSAYVSTFDTEQIEYPPALSISSVVVASLITMSCSLTTTLFIGRRIRGVDMVSSLKNVE